MNTSDIYAAGLIDGEGTITLGRRNSKSKFRYPVVSATSTTYELIQFLHDTFGGKVRSHRVYQPHHKPSWIWSVEYLPAIQCMLRILPYCKEPNKLRRMQLITSQYPTLTVRNGKYSPEETAAKLKFEATVLSS